MGERRKQARFGYLGGPSCRLKPRVRTTVPYSGLAMHLAIAGRKLRVIHCEQKEGKRCVYVRLSSGDHGLMSELVRFEDRKKVNRAAGWCPKTGQLWPRSKHDREKRIYG